MLRGWRAFRPEDTWTDALADDAGFYEITPGTGLPDDRALQRGVAIGLRPTGQQASHEAFALLRGLVIHEIESEARASAAAIKADVPPRAADLYRVVTAMYQRAQQGYARA